MVYSDAFLIIILPFYSSTLLPSTYCRFFRYCDKRNSFTYLIVYICYPKYSSITYESRNTAIRILTSLFCDSRLRILQVRLLPNRMSFPLQRPQKKGIFFRRSHEQQRVSTVEVCCFLRSLQRRPLSLRSSRYIHIYYFS